MSSAWNSRSWLRLNVRLALWHSALVFVIVSAVLALSNIVLRARVEEKDREVVHFRLKQYASEYQRRGLEGAINLASLRKGRMQKAFFVRIADPSNRTLFARDAEDWAEFYPEQLEKRTAAKEGKVDWLTLWSNNRDSLLLAETRLADGTIMQVGRTTEDSQIVLEQFHRVTTILIAIVIPVSIAGGAFIAGRVLRPLRALARTVREIEGTSRFSMRTPVSGSGDELDELSRVFNSAMARIERLLATMRDSLDNVAHDLRTPMTRLRNRAQACLEGTVNPEMQREALIDCVEESDRVLEMLNALMDIAEAEAGLTKTDQVPVDLGGVIAAACDLYAEVAEDRNITVTCSAEQDCHVKCDAVLLRRVIANLLDNALKYTPAGGKVQVTARRREHEVELQVIDTGHGIPQADLPKLWDRLFRGDRSRSERGLGLGLSFVKAIVDANGGRVQVESKVHEGSTFTVIWPAAEASSTVEERS
jgi:heavy metal sensor kinase